MEMSESRRREIAAVITSDLKTSGATTAAALRAASIASVKTLFPPTVTVEVTRDQCDPSRVIQVRVICGRDPLRP